MGNGGPTQRPAPRGRYSPAFSSPRAAAGGGRAGVLACDGRRRPDTGKAPRSRQ